MLLPCGISPTSPIKSFDDLWLAGVPVKRLMDEYGMTLNDVRTYLPADADELAKSDIEVHYLGYYLKWTPQEVVLLCRRAYRLPGAPLPHPGHVRQIQQHR